MNIFIYIIIRIFAMPLISKEADADLKVWVAEKNKKNHAFVKAWAIGLILFVAFTAVPAIVAMIISLKLFYWVAEGGCVITFVWVIARIVPLSIKGMLSQQKQE
ncbi:hypothetical protein [Ktedonobacter racemifer]|uniref:Uncharacterized protein n=1 Tax=Ktedonobacter racemifer DSM 44963 TaxID=485913 RepID=D6TIU2_KTERA|nr:hypothetical protein [Ktedonobacter racemifer]EFH89349.1 hypothetical protein Krac_10899 [Ktedonobacter racemifer DSM 44963]